MENIHTLQYKNQSREQLHPDLTDDFPYTVSLVEIDKYKDGFVPWHWHEEVELFYIENGVLEYDIPKGKLVFPKGSGGLVNSNVLHKWRYFLYFPIFQNRGKYWKKSENLFN